MGREYIDQWVSIHGSAAAASVQVLVPTTDRLTTPRKAPAPQPPRTRIAAPAATKAAPPSQPPAASAEAAAAQVDELPSPGLTLRISSGDAGDSDGELESPVSLWISPGRIGQPGSAASRRSATSPLAEEAGRGGAVEAVRDVVQEILDRVEGRLAAAPAAPEFQFDTLPAAAVPDRPAAWPPARTPSPPPYAATPAHFRTLVWILMYVLRVCRFHAPRWWSVSMKVNGTRACRAVAVCQGTNSGGSPPQSELPTAFVQDMLMTDPVHALGLRVTRAPGATLEFVSLEEAKTELRACPFPPTSSARLVDAACVAQVMHKPDARRHRATRNMH